MPKIRNPFRQPTIEEARQRIAAGAEAASLHHQLEALRLRYEIAQLTTLADNHDGLAETYARLSKGHAS